MLGKVTLRTSQVQCWMWFGLVGVPQGCANPRQNCARRAPGACDTSDAVAPELGDDHNVYFQDLSTSTSNFVLAKFVLDG